LSLSLYENFIGLPFNPSREKYEEIIRTVKDSNLILNEQKEYIQNLNDFREKCPLLSEKNNIVYYWYTNNISNRVSPFNDEKIGSF